jgi:hypothetical protein
MARQLSLKFGNKHGGRRKGAGRKPVGAVAGVSHRPRAEFVRRRPVLVTQRIAADCPSLRRFDVLAVFRRLVVRLSDERFAVVHWVLISNHLHLVVEAEDSLVLARKLGGFFGQLAKELNRLWKRAGRVFPDRFDARVLGSPTAVRTALVYVLGNGRKHGAWRGRGPDTLSSGSEFDGWSDWVAQSSGLPRARTWLLGVGWKKLGRFSVLSAPKVDDEWEREPKRARKGRSSKRRVAARA